MKRIYLICLFQCLTTTFLLSQSSPVPTPTTATTGAAKPKPQVAPTDPVITIKGVCADAPKTGDSCKTVITKEQFEKLINALQPDMTPDVRRQLATAYSRMLVMSADAEKRGIDKQPQYDETLRFARLQILSQRLSRDLQSESEKVPDADIEKYYQENAGAYDQATLLRIFIPKSKIPTSEVPKSRQTPPPKSAVAVPAAKVPAAEAGGAAAKPAATEEPADSAAPEKAAQEAMTKVAADLRARAVKGEDFEKLQKEAFVRAGLRANAPPAKMDKVRQTTLPAAHKPVLDLKPGEISAVIDDPSGHYIYKMVGKQTLSFDAVKAEIRYSLATQRYQDAMQAYEASPDLNDAYFGTFKVPTQPSRGTQKPVKLDDDD
jgi:bifunctional DNA-binding transcriptional regulator/antitoxin component of YhaV-PrlF toxin-antitoxin module